MPPGTRPSITPPALWPGSSLQVSRWILEPSTGEVNLFFFHLDCRIDGALRLQVRDARAGFFSDQELAQAPGLLWAPDHERPSEGPLESGPSTSRYRSFNHQQILDLSRGRIFECMGRGFERARDHVRTPRLAAGPLLLLDRVTDFEPRGGPWGRGYLRAQRPIRSDDWFFRGHFLNDPCMPGSLMLEGGLETMALYLTALGFTLERDCGRFEPLPSHSWQVRCGGQVVPSCREMVYELFVRQVIGAPRPTLIADLLASVDGRKALHARNVGLCLVD